MIDALIKYRYVSAFLVLVALIFSISQLDKLEVNTDFDQFLPEGDSELDFFYAWKEAMGDDEDYLAIGIAAPETVFDWTFLREVKRFEDSLRKMPKIRKVTSLTTLTKPSKSPFGIITFPYIHFDRPDGLHNDSLKVFRDFHWTCHFINKEANTLVSYIRLEQGLNAEEVTMVLKQIKGLRAEFSGLKTHMTGRKFAEAEFKSILAGETSGLIFYVLGFIILILIIIYRDALSILLPLFLVICSLLLFFGWLAATGRPLNIMANLFPTILLIVAISDIIHLGGKYYEERKRGFAAREACRISLKEIGWTTFLTSFTTAVGFMTLYISPMRALKDFGLEAAFGVLLAFVVTILLAPSVILMMKEGHLFRMREGFARRVSRLFSEIEKLHKKGKWVIAAFAVLIGLSLVGALFINTNNRQLSNVPNNSDLKASYDFFEQRTGGARSFELALMTKDTFKLNDPLVLASLKQAHLYLEGLPYLKNVQSPVSIYHAAYRVYRPSDTATLVVPVNTATVLKYEKDLEKFRNGTLSILNKEKTKGRIKARINDLGRREIDIKNAEIISQLNAILDTTQISFRVTGIDHLADRAHAKRISNMFEGLAIAIAVVALVMGLVYRNVALTLITLLLNLIPVVIVAGVMGLTGLELRGATSIVFTIGFVIAVDDTIHFLSKFKLERNKGLSVEKALHISLIESGNAILVTSLILIGGFALMMTSDFTEVFAHGFLVSIMVVSALAVDLILAPALILTFFKKMV